MSRSRARGALRGGAMALTAPAMLAAGALAGRVGAGLDAVTALSLLMAVSTAGALALGAADAAIVRWCRP